MRTVRSIARTMVVGLLLNSLNLGGVEARADSQWLYGIHWYGSHAVTEVEQMTGGKGIWVLEIVLTEDTGTWSLAQQLPKFQAIVARGHTLIIRIHPRWNLVVPGPDNAPNVGDRMSTFLPKLTSTVQQLSSLCHIWQIGNEMNLAFEYDLGPMTPALYVEKYKVIRNAIKAVPSSLGPQVVLLGPVAPVDNAWLGGMLNNLTANDFDGFGLHAYGGALGSFRDMYRSQLLYIDSRGYQNKPIYLLEWGAPVNPISDTNEAGTALFLRNELQELANWNAGAGNHNIVCAIWFVYAADAGWSNWSIRYLRDLHPRGANTDLWDSFQAACALNLPAGAGAGGSNPGNNPPKAVASGSPLSGSKPLTVNFSGSGSSDPDAGQTLTYFWNFGDNTTGSGVSTSHTYNNDGSYTVTLTVSDGNGGVDTDTLTVTVGGGGETEITGIIKNPNFQDNNGAFGVALHWTGFGGNKWESAFDAARSWVQGVSDLPVNNGFAGVRQTFAVTSGRKYRLTVGVKVNNAGLDAAIGASPNGGTEAAGATFGTPTSSTNWTDISVEFTATGSSATVFLRGRNPTASAVVGGWVFFDGVRLFDISLVVPIVPTIGLSTGAFSHAVEVGSSLPSDTFTVSNSGTGTLNYSISTNVNWLSINPDSGSSTGELDLITVSYNVAGLPVGTHQATILVSDPAASNTPRTISVTVQVEPSASVPPDFDQDGDVDQQDFGYLQSCFSAASGQHPPASCDAARLDADVDVDQDDLVLFLVCFSGPGTAPSQECINLFR